MDENTLNYLRKLARENVCKGVLYEPRLFFDRVTFAIDGQDEVFADSEVFVNGEEFPVRITHILAAMDVGGVLSPPPTPVQGDPRLIQRIGLRVMSHDTYYRHGNFIPLPLMHNVHSAASPVTSPGVSTWKFPFPVVLAKRDAFVVPVELNTAPLANQNRRVGCALGGLGQLSRRPVQLSADTVLTDTNETDLDIGDLRSDGAEPVEIYELNWWSGPESDDNDGAGDIRQLSCGIRQTGNGTHENWHRAPKYAGAPDKPPATLWGVSEGRAVVHELPIDPENPASMGWTFQPGQGVQIALKNFDTTRQQTVEENVWVALAGYIIRT